MECVTQRGFETQQIPRSCHRSRANAQIIYKADDVTVQQATVVQLSGPDAHRQMRMKDSWRWCSVHYVHPPHGQVLTNVL